MRKLSILVGIVFLTGGIVTELAINVSAEESLIPSWVKNNAKWWAEGTINDDSFIQGIQFLIKEKIIEITSTKQNEGVKGTDIPGWVKNNAKWWADDLLPETDFLNGMEYLVKEGIIQIPQDDLLISTLEENESDLVSKSWVSENVKNCTKKSPEITYPDYDEYVSEKCLIDKANSVNECRAFENTEMVKTKVLTSTEIKDISIKFDVDECIQEIAIKNNDPKICSSVQDELPCFIKYVEKTNEQNACLEAPNPLSCVKSLVNIYGVESCDVISGEKNKQCKINYIRTQNNLSESEYSRLMRNCAYPGESGPWYFACQLEIMNPNVISKEEMLELKSDNGQTILCAKIGPSGEQDDARNDDLCVAAEAVYTLNRSQCDNSGTSRTSCYQALALHDPKFTLTDCHELDKQDIWNCYTNVAARTEDNSICSIESEFNYGEKSEKDCMNFVNYYKSWRNYGVYSDVGSDTIFPKYD